MTGDPTPDAKDTHFDLSKIEIPQHRPEIEILRDLEALAASTGYVHALSFMCWRDNFVSYVEEIVPSDLYKMKSHERLLRSELTLLIGLMVKSPIDIAFPGADKVETHIRSTEALFDELHHTLNIPMIREVAALAGARPSPTDAGLALREPFFYGAESAYFFQFRDFAVDRFALDAEWLTANKGFSAEDVKDVIQAIAVLQTRKLEQIRCAATPELLDRLTLLPAFTFSPTELSEASGVAISVVQKIVDTYSLPPSPCNSGLEEIGGFNEAQARPIINLGEAGFVLLQNYDFAQSAYESPFFWFVDDPAYTPTANIHRGEFTESFCARRLASVFGEARVYQNVNIEDGKNVVGEIDVLVVYADRAIILQAKSKKLTVAARKGDEEAIRTDFKKAVQDAYDQGVQCGTFLLDPRYVLKDATGSTLQDRRDFAEIFVLCVVSDHYPALAHQADQFLKRREHDVIQPAFVVDVFFLDVACELLDSPLQFFNFLHRRLLYGQRIKSNSELALLSYHLAHNLWFDDQYDFIDVGECFSVNVDAAMLARRENIPGKTIPEGILTKLNGTFFERIINQVDSFEGDDIFELGYFLLEMGEDSARDFGSACEMLVQQAKADGGLHDCTFAFGKTGITVHSSFLPQEQAYERLHAHVLIGKYRVQAHTWYGMALNPHLDGALDFVLGCKFPWVEDEETSHAVKTFSQPGAKSLKKALRQSSPAHLKAGRNDPCPCGSGKKYKKCHGR